MSYKVFIVSFILSISILLLIAVATSYALRSMDYTYTNNDLIRKYQMEKLMSVGNVHTIIVGDSSAGNAINSSLFSELTHLNTLNIALTGSFGFVGSYNMIRNAHDLHPELKVVIIMYALDTWNSPFSYQGYEDTLYKLTPAISLFIASDKHVDRFQYLFNPKEIWWFIKSHITTDQVQYIKNDFLAQRNVPSQINWQPLHDVIHSDKVRAMSAINEVCQEYSLQCIYVNGPIYMEVASSSQTIIENIKKVMELQDGIMYVDHTFSYPRSMIGDSIDHINTDFKDVVTAEYAHILLPLLHIAR